MPSLFQPHPPGRPDYTALSFPDPPPDRPYVIVNMVSAADGKITIEGTERGLGSKSDQLLMRELRVHADGTPVGGRGHLSVFAFYPNKQVTTGEGGAVVCPDAAVKERIDSERNQGRAPDMGWLDHDRLGFNYRLSDVACALGLAQLERLDDLLAARAQVAAWYGEALTFTISVAPASASSEAGCPGCQMSSQIVRPTLTPSISMIAGPGPHWK